ncbi:MAG: hypothetical protein IT472_08000 [Thermomonas sp.]|nr:hypothetical protein [Thermomonas sp.]MCC7097105.1 hypothetical protein [Thermomonas sp.]
MAMDSRQSDHDPVTAAAHKRARRTAWILALAVLALYGWVVLTGGGMR